MPKKVSKTRQEIWKKVRKPSQSYLKRADELFPGFLNDEYPNILYNFIIASYKVLDLPEVQKIVFQYLKQKIGNSPHKKYEEIGKELVGDKKKKKVNRMRANAGIREDLGNVEFRSGLEANVARYFNYMNWTWTHEPQRFYFKSYSTGAKSYLPDFLVTTIDNQQFYIEVKGRLLPNDKSRLTRFKKHYPDEATNLFMYTWKSSKDVIKFCSMKNIQVVLINELPIDEIDKWEGKRR